MNRIVWAGILIVVAVLGIFYFFRNQSPSMSSTTPTPASPSASQGGLTQSTKQYASAPEIAIDAKKNYQAVIQTSKGAMRVALFASEAPITVNNFVFLAREGFYAGTPFHRIIKEFMIQGGDPTGTGVGSPGYRFDDEAVTREYVRGTIAMANSGPNTNGSQFFIMHADYALAKNYVIFGSIEATDSTSLATLDAIASVPVGTNGTGEQSAPQEKVIIESVTIEEK